MPRVTFVVVQKRHHTRLFPAEHGSRDQTDKSGNILPGFVSLLYLAVLHFTCPPPHLKLLILCTLLLKGLSWTLKYATLGSLIFTSTVMLEYK